MKVQYTILFVLLMVMGWLYSMHLQPTLKAITNYSAQCACTNLHFTGRDIKNIQKYDLHPTLVPVKITRNGDYVHASTLHGLISSTAVKNNGRGCITLYDGVNPVRSKNHEYPRKIYNAHTLTSNVVDSRSKFPEIDFEKLDEAVDELFDKDGADELQTRSLLIIHKGQLIVERYGLDSHRKTLMISYALNDFFTNVLLGMMVADDMIQLDDDHLFEEWKNDSRKHITVENLMRIISADSNRVYKSVQIVL